MSLRPISPKRLARLTAEGLLRWGSTFARSTVTERKRPRDTGPSREVKALINRRAGGLCEFPKCWRRPEHTHHRKPRRSGGTSDPAVNGAANCTRLCGYHHGWIESFRAAAYELGWLLRAGEVPAEVPVLTRHADGKVLLDDDGGMRAHDVG